MKGVWSLGIVSFALASDPAHGQNRADTATPQETETMYYRSIFGTEGPEPPGMPLPAPITLDVAHARMEARLGLLIDDVDRRATLTELQRRKLHAAGEQDIRQFFDRLEQVKEKYLSAPSRLARREFITDRLRLASDFIAGLFDERSFVSKIMESTLDQEQIAKISGSRQGRHVSRWKTRASLMAESWGEAIGMDQGQRHRLSELIVAEIPPPARMTRLDFCFTMFKLSRIPQAKVRPIFDDAQWKLFSQQLAENGDVTTKAVLIQRGYDLGEANPAKPKPETEPAK